VYYNIQFYINLKTFNTPVKVKLFESPGKVGGLPILIKRKSEKQFHMAAKFESFLDRKKQYRFHLKSSNGEIIAASEAYDTKAAVPTAKARKPRNRKPKTE
jgi:uncharacterized protein YegP (UPF0339 family)